MGDWCIHCGREVVLSDDGTRWLHKHGIHPFPGCPRTPADVAGQMSTGKG